MNNNPVSEYIILMCSLFLPIVTIVLQKRAKLDYSRGGCYDKGRLLRLKTQRLYLYNKEEKNYEEVYKRLACDSITSSNAMR